jgi:hypothetical protein
MGDIIQDEDILETTVNSDISDKQKEMKKIPNYGFFGIKEKEKEKPYNININNYKKERTIQTKSRYSDEQKFRVFTTKVEPKLLKKLVINEENDTVKQIKKAFGLDNKEENPNEISTSTFQTGFMSEYPNMDYKNTFDEPKDNSLINRINQAKRRFNFDFNKKPETEEEVRYELKQMELLKPFVDETYFRKKDEDFQNFSRGMDYSRELRNDELRKEYEEFAKQQARLERRLARIEKERKEEEIHKEVRDVFNSIVDNLELLEEAIPAFGKAPEDIEAPEPENIEDAEEPSGGADKDPNKLYYLKKERVPKEVQNSEDMITYFRQKTNGTNMRGPRPSIDIFIKNKTLLTQNYQMHKARKEINALRKARDTSGIMLPYNEEAYTAKVNAPDYLQKHLERKIKK